MGEHMSQSRTPSTIPFSVPYVTGRELDNLAAVIASDHTQGDGPFTRRATETLERISGARSALLTSSCSHALDMSMQLLELEPGDEVIVPSFTFPSAANSVALSGATAVFVDCEPTTGNIDAEQAIAAVTPKTKAIVVMHYGGMPVNLEPILNYAAAHEIAVIEDAAHGIGVQTTAGKLGTLGTFGTFSFHATKNVQSGEGGALLVNDERYQLAAEIVREKGTNRSQFLRGEVDKYTWMGRGSSYLPSEYTAAVLDVQLDDFNHIQSLRESIWNRYALGLTGWAAEHGVQLMQPPHGLHAAHLFYLLVPRHEQQDQLIAHLRQQGIVATFHYQPLHSSPAGLRWGRPFGELSNSIDFSQRLVRLPLWAGMSDEAVQRVIAGVTTWHPEARS